MWKTPQQTKQARSKHNHTSYDVNSVLVRAEEGELGEAPLHLLQDPRADQAGEHPEAGLLARFQPGQAVPGPHAEIREPSSI